MISITAGRSEELVTAGTNKNLFVTLAGVTGSASTATGTEVLPASNATTASTFDRWRATESSGAATWLLDADAYADDITCVGIAGHNIGTLGATVKPQYNNGTWVDAGSAVAPTDDSPVLWRFQGVDDATDWRLLVTSIPSGEDVYVSVIYIGRELIFEQPGTASVGSLYDGFSPPLTPSMVDLRTNITEGAQYVTSAFVERGSMISVPLSHLSQTQIRGADYIAWQRRWNSGRPSFLAWRPVEHSGDVYYCWRDGGAVRPTNSLPSPLMSLEISARVYEG